MQIFIRVVDTGSFSRASEVMDIPKSTVTRLIQTLESELRVKLLHRTTRRITVTPEGEAYYEGAQRLLSQVAELENTVTARVRAPAGRVRIELSGSIAYQLIIPALPDFFQRYPDIQLETSINNSSIDLLAENADCVIRVGELLNESLIARHLADLPFATVASGDYLARHGEPRHPGELADGHNMVQMFSSRSGRVFKTQWRNGDRCISAPPHHHIAVNDSTAGLNAALAGLGIISTYRFLVLPYLQTGALRSILTGWQTVATPLHIAWPANRHVTHKVRVFIEWVSQLATQWDRE